ncbi:MAG TPA: FHA domain-containing protein [Polyangiaceae bacterium]|jgi:pSer/pThr/pTyr-binding forkhead associated (FHA) protein|nr:FHA domain-containing protein [Polyangiaceae bacterium]
MNVEVEILASDTGKRSTQVLAVQASIVIGRARDCHLALEHEQVSRKHAVVRLGEDLLRVEDTSRNGTLAGGLVLHNTVTEIPWGAPIGIGSYQLTFRRTPRSREPGEHSPVPAQKRRLNTPITLEEVPGEALRQALGPLRPYLDDDRVSEVLVNGSARIYVARGGQFQLTTSTFADAEAVLRMVSLVAEWTGQHFDEQHPVLRTRLPDGRPVHAVAPPAAVGGPYVTIGPAGKDRYDAS